MLLDVQADCIAARQEVLALSAQLEGLVGAVRAFLESWNSPEHDDAHLSAAESAMEAAASLVTPSSALAARDVEMVRVGLEAAAKECEKRGGNGPWSWPDAARIRSLSPASVLAEGRKL
jgi:hypothetical protein